MHLITLLNKRDFLEIFETFYSPYHLTKSDVMKSVTYSIYPCHFLIF